MRPTYLGCCALSALIAGVAHSPAASSNQTAAEAGGAASDRDGGLGEIVVVARRQEENLQSVPLTVTAISGDTLQAASITEGSDLIRLIPTLNVQQPSTQPGVQYSLRGIRTGVVTYLNDVQTVTQAVNDQLWDLASVQALAGPQGTLFGRNSTGGAILFVPQRPTNKFAGSIEAGSGNYNERDTVGVLNVPISESLQFRLGGHFIRHDPMVENLLGPGMQSEDRTAARLSILFTPNAAISNYTVFDFTNRNETPPPFISSNVPATAGCFPGLGCLYGTLPSRYGRLQDELGPRKISSSFYAVQRAKDYGVSNILKFEATDALTFKYIFGLRRTSSYSFQNQSTLDLPLEIGCCGMPYGKTVINELQFLGRAFGARLIWTTGIYLSDEHDKQYLSYELFGDPTLPFSDSRNTLEHSTNKVNSKALYGQATYGFTGKLNLTGGLRYTQDEPGIKVFSVGPAFTFFGPQVCSLPGGPGVDLASCTRYASAKYHALTYNISLDYRLTGGTLLYAATRRGYNAGGFNPSNPNHSDSGGPTLSYGPEHITDYEAGVKSDWRIASMPVRTNLSVFLAKYSDIQRISNGVTASGILYGGIANGPKATLYGVQLESTIRLFAGLTLNANYGYLRSKYDEGTRAFPKDNQFAQAPEQTLNLGGTYIYSMPTGGDLVLAGGYTYQSSVTFQDANTPLGFQGGFGLWDARLSWKNVADSRVDLSVYGKNLSNKLYALERQDQVNFLGSLDTLYADPRTCGVQLTYTFGK
jgi:iron complex outermembrane receptor protein